MPKEIYELPLNVLDVDMKVEFIQALISIGLWHVKEVLEQEVKRLAGERYERGGLPGHDRWGKQGGCVYLGEQKLSIEVPKVGDQPERKEGALRSYNRFQESRGGNEGVLEADSSWVEL
jgi:hypothetical protein